jgi:hypothetical protein
MNLLYPSFLIGLTAILIPIIIHLFDFRRTKKVYFSNTRLLNQVKESTRSFYNLKHLLILISRILFIAALVFAFAQPYLPALNESGLTANKVAIYIDNSMSMSNKVDEDESGLDLAKSTAEEIINLYPSGTEFIIQSSFDEKTNYLYRSKQEAQEYVSELSFSSNYRTIDLILSNFKKTYTGIPPKEIILISDFQKETLMKSEIKSDSVISLILAPIRFPSYSNLSIDTAHITNPFELDKSKTNLVVKLRNHSDLEVNDIPVKLFLGERQLSVTTAAVGGLNTTDISFNIGYNLTEEQNGRLVIEDYPLSFDNELFFTLRSIDRIKVVEINGVSPSPYVPAVFGNKLLFDFSRMSSSNLNLGQLQDADLIVLNQLNMVSQGVITRLGELRRGGANLLLIPGQNPSVPSYQGLLNRIRLVDGDSQRIVLQAPDFKRPFYQNIVEQVQDNLAMPSAKPVWQWGGDRNALLKFIDGKPFLSELENGLFVLASPLVDSYSNFQTSAVFVPIMYRIASNSRQNLPALFNRLGEQEITIDAVNITPQSILRLSKGNIDFLPDQRLKGRKLVMVLPSSIMTPGHYDVLNDQEYISSLALNLNTVESNIAVLNEQEISSYFSGFRYNIVGGSNKEEIIRKFNEDYKGIELWRYFLGLALVFLFIEALLIRLL